jgi:hypothetical protein
MYEPSSGTTAKLTFVCWAQTCAALRIWFCQTEGEPNLALKVANRLL